MPITTIVARLGHESPNTTLKVYAHLFDGMDDVATDVMDRMYGEPSSAAHVH